MRHAPIPVSTKTKTATPSRRVAVSDLALLVRQLLHTMRHKHRLPADGILQHQTHDAQIDRRSSTQAAKPRQPALELREWRAIHGSRPGEQHAGNSVRVELEGAGSGIRAANHPRTTVSFVPQNN